MAKRGNGEGSVYRVGDRWRAAITLDDGQHVSKKFANRGDAAAWLAEIAADIQRGDYVARNNATVSGWIGEYLMTYVAPRVRPRTLERYIATANHINPLGDIPLQELRAPQVQSLLNKLSQTLGGSSLLKVYDLLSRALAKATALGMVSKNIMLAVERPSYEQPEIETFTRDEISKLLSAVKESREYSRYYLFFLAAVSTGARLGELLALRRSSIGADRLYIRASLSRADGQTMETPPKTRAGRREITVNQELCRELREQSTDCRVVEMNPYVFHTSSGRPYGARNIQMAQGVRRNRRKIMTIHKSVELVIHTVGAGRETVPSRKEKIFS